MALTVASRLGGYEITALIGEGGMGQVFRARDTKLHHDVALKILTDVFASDQMRAIIMAVKFASWHQLDWWLRNVDGLRGAA